LRGMIEVNAIRKRAKRAVAKAGSSPGLAHGSE
jgi:hypothetical protein